MPPSVAESVDEPPATAVARPVLLIVATAGVADAHVTTLVRFCVELSVNVPVAVNCRVWPFAMVGLAGVTATDCSAAAATVRTVEPLTPPNVAEMADVPVATAVAKPEPEIVATAGV